MFAEKSDAKKTRFPQGLFYKNILWPNFNKMFDALSKSRLYYAATKKASGQKQGERMANKLVYLFGGKKADGNSTMKNLLGGKGANLAEMARIGLPVPAGFTITTEVCTAYYANKKKYPTALKDRN